MLHDSPGIAVERLSRYLAEVAEYVGARPGGSYFEAGPPAGAYLALRRRAAAFPACGAALVWEEEHGWAVGVESRASGDLVVLSCLGGDVAPGPEIVGGFVASVLAAVPPSWSQL